MQANEIMEVITEFSRGGAQMRRVMKIEEGVKTTIV